MLAALILLPFLMLESFLPQASARPDSYSWPVQGNVLRGFEKPKGAYGEGGHQGIDIAAPAGATVRAAGDGAVTWVGELPRGKFVTVSHSGGTKTTYLDLDTIAVAIGQAVHRGQAIGTLCGKRDSSSPASHLHFGASLNGSPIDPRVLLDGIESTSYIRLCPVDRPGGAPSGPGRPAESGEQSIWQVVARPIDSAFRLVGDGTGIGWRGVCAAGGWTATGFDRFWDRAAYPVLRKCGQWTEIAAKFCWGNRYFKAIVAGLAAAAVIIVVIVVIVITLPVSVVCGVVAAIAVVVAALVTAIYYTGVHPANFNFADCFFKCLSVGAATAATVISLGSLGAAFSAGWAEMGLIGSLKCAISSGALSAAFEGSVSYLFTGRLSIKRILIAFCVGAVSGPIGKAMKDGIMGSRAVQALTLILSESKIAVGWGAAIVFLKESGNTMSVMVIVLKEGATAFGGKAVYLVFSGAFGTSLHITSSMLSHKPITFSGMFAAFLTGVVMGGIGLTFGGLGLEGMLARFTVFSEGLGLMARRLAGRILSKSMRKALNSGLTAGFKRLFHEKEPGIAKEE